MAYTSSHLIMEKDHMDKLYKSKNPLVNFFHNQRLKTILDFIPSNNRVRILDAGCGEGHLLKKIHKKNPEAILYGVDITKVALISAKKRVPTGKFLLQDTTKLSLKEEFFDIVICQDALEHIYDYKKVLSNLKKVTKKGGIIVLSYPNENNLTLSRFLLFKWPPKIQDHVNSFNPRKIREEINLPLFKQINLPINLPPIFSLETIQFFKKEKHKNINKS